MGNEGLAGEYLFTETGWKILPQDHQTLAPLLKQVHGYNFISSFFTYQLNNQIRGVSMGNKGLAGVFEADAA